MDLYIPIGSAWPGADTGAARSVNQLAGLGIYDRGGATLPIGWVQAAGIGNLVRSSGHPTTAPLSTLGMEASGDALDGQLCNAAEARVE